MKLEVKEVGPIFDIDHSEIPALSALLKKGTNFLAEYLNDNVLKNIDEPAKSLIRAAITAVLGSLNRVQDNDKGNGVRIIMPWQWIALGFFWFFEIYPRPLELVGQDNWRWCHKCQGLFFSGGQDSIGNCPAGGQHEKSVSGNYALAHNAPDFSGQHDWRWCHKCQGLFFSAGQDSIGSCPAGGQHEKGVSGNYALAHNAPNTPGQQDWRWCHKCWGLFFSGGQESVGSCPAGGQHEKGVSGMYTLGHTSA
jgi:hypothetical protein